MTDFHPELADEPDSYWDADRINERDEWDQHLRQVEQDERDHRTRDMGEAA